MAAFATAASISSAKASFAGATCVTSAPVTPLSPSAPRAARLQTRTKVAPTAQYNYNIYQDNEDRSRRNIAPSERAVTVAKPLGLILEEGQEGMVFVAEIDPAGNAAEEGDIQEGDIVVAVSATFGDDVWSTRGVGLERVMKSIRVRAGDLVTLVLETPAELSQRNTLAAAQAEQKRTVARDTRGEREVINPVTWASEKNVAYEDGDPAQAEISEALKEKLKGEIAQPYEQGWILYISAGIGVLALLLVASGISG